MRLTFLGTGTSVGIPQLGCQCRMCTSTDVHDRRLRTSAIIETASGGHILLDCGPDFRQQMLRYCSEHPQPAVHTPHGVYRLPRLEGVLVTHIHYDHVGGLDDVRPFAAFGPLAVYAEEDCAMALRRQMPYCFSEHPYPGSPQIQLRVVRPHESFEVAGECITPIRVMHGRLPILGYRIGDLAYITDMKTMPEDEMSCLDGVRLLVVNALRVEPHNTHQTVADAIAFARRVGAPQTYFIHMGHTAPLHSEGPQVLPPGMSFAYDGLSVELP